MQPLQLPGWTTFPSDDEIVDAVVGRGGSDEARARVRVATQELVLPSLLEDRTLPALRSSFEELRASFEAEAGDDPADRMVRVAVKAELSRLVFRSMALSEARLHDALWPSEPFPERWSPGADLHLTPGEIAAAARAIEARLRSIQDHYGIQGRGEQRSEALIRNSVAVATSGDYASTYGPVFDELRARGVTTSPLPAATPL